MSIETLLEELSKNHNKLMVPHKKVLFILARIEELELYSKEKKNGEFQDSISDNNEA